MAKNNERLWMMLKYILIIGGIIASLALGYGALNHQVDTNSKDIDQHDDRITKVEECVIEQRVDIRYIKETTKKILEKVEK